MKLIRIVTAILVGFSIPAGAATLVVISLADSGPGSLRDTVAASLPGDEITFGVTGVIPLTSGAITIGNAISVLGPGPASLTVSGSGLDRVFVTSANPVLIANLTIRNGRVVGPNGPDGGVGQNGGPGLPAQGGGIYNSGTLTLSNCWIAGCMAVGGNGGRGGDNPIGAAFVPGTGGAGGEADGGGIYNAAGYPPTTLSLVGCTLSGNQAISGNGGAGGNNLNAAVAESGGTGGAGADSYGGGILSGGPVLTNCTLSGNFAIGGAGGQGGNTFATFIGGTGGNGGVGHCGGISTFDHLALFSCTIVLNQGVGGPAGPGGSGTPNGPSGSAGSGYGGGICGYTIAPCGGANDIGNTIVANNDATLHPNQVIYFQDRGYNFLSDNDTCGVCMGPTTRMGTLLFPLDPLLAPLAQNGGGMPTHAPLWGSPVIDQGNSFGLVTDQRGAPRTYDYLSVPNQADGTDIGAVELGSAAPGLGVVGGNNIVLSWPAYYQDLQLQSTPTLGPGNRWADVTDTPWLSQGRLYVTNRLSDPSRFYRLINR
jgi:hypothetical protein